MSNVNPSGRNVRPQGHNWAPGLGSIPDDYELQPPHPLSSLQSNNRSVPSLPSQQAGYQDERQNPAYDPSSALDSFSALHVSEPIQRAGSAMSTRSAHSNLMMRPPQHSQTLPTSQYSNDNASLYSQDSRMQPSVYYDDQASYDNLHSPEGYHSQGYSPPAWQQNDPSYANLYTAASSVLGMGPPPGAPPAGPSQQPGYYEQPSRASSFASSAPSLPLGNSYHRHAPPSVYSGDSDIDPRPSLPRGETAMSVKPSTAKSKAIDLSAPPFTKQYIDQYRQRIKGDPDPEVHFSYAKYLIDAARHIRSQSKDQRSAKKYSEVLIGEALKVIRRLATQGEAYDEAQFYLANCFGTGTLGLQVDHERAYHLYLQAAKQNHAGACYRVAVCNEIGAGTRREPPRAAAFYRKAASLGDTAAMYKLGMILLNGSFGEGKNPREAVGWLKRAAEQADEENPHALYELAMLHENPNQQLVQHDPLQAKNLYTGAAHLGYIQAQYKLGQCYEYGALTCPVDARRSIAWYTKAAEKGDAEAELALSGWYLTGSEGVLKQSDSEAYLWARRAANKGLSKAEYAVGYYAEVGIGIKQDIEFAKRWYMRAAAQGNKRAMNRLTEMKRQGNKRPNMARPTRQQAKDECVIC